jgi:hypothetical protein
MRVFYDDERISNADERMSKESKELSWGWESF